MRKEVRRVGFSGYVQRAVVVSRQGGKRRADWSDRNRVGGLYGREAYVRWCRTNIRESSGRIKGIDETRKNEMSRQ